MRRLSAQSYTNGSASGNNGGKFESGGGGVAANNLSYESIVNANYDVEEEDNKGSNHRLEREAIDVYGCLCPKTSMEKEASAEETAIVAEFVFYPDLVGDFLD